MSGSNVQQVSKVQDVVGVFDSSLKQLFDKARPLRALVRDKADFPKHPMESGATISDNRIFLPIGIELSMVLTPENYRDTYQQIMTAYRGTEALSVQTKAQTYENMFIEDPSHDETAEIFDTIAISLKLRQIQFVAAQYAALPPSRVRSPRNSSTSRTGQKTPQTATPAQSSVAHDLFFGQR